jgi:pyrimidine operon attenuation protein/uracil phosphoribosyltransferase
MPTRQRVQVMDGDSIQRELLRLAREIHEAHPEPERLALVGVRTRGVPLADRLAEALRMLRRERPPCGTLDINLYRDDVALMADHPVLRSTEIPFSIVGASIVLVDDVLFTGRTVRAALDGLHDLGRPARIRLAVLVERGHRELPIQADYIGHSLRTRRDEQIDVRLAEIDDVDEVLRVSPPGSAAARAVRKGSPR